MNKLIDSFTAHITITIKRNKNILRPIGQIAFSYWEYKASALLKIHGLIT